MPLVHRAVTWAWSLLLAVLLLGPALGHGLVLSYDMVWVPDLALRSDFLGVATGLPRAVPSDALVSLVDELVPGMLLQKLVLVGSLMGGGLGAARLTGGRSLPEMLAALTLYQWNPLVAERLQIGAWPILVGYAVLPWLIGAAQSWRRGRVPARLLWLAPLGCLSAGAGLVAALVVIAFGATRSGSRNLALVVLVLAANAPWLVSGILHAPDADSSAAGAQVFGLEGAGAMPAPVTALTLGGIWNSEVVLPSRSGVLAWLGLALVLLLVVLGARRWWRLTPSRDAVALATCWIVGWSLAVTTWAAPTLVGWLVGHLPGAGVVRDGSRFLVLCAPLLVLVSASGVARLVRAVPVPARPTVVLAAMLLPLALLPDAALGLAGRLRAVDYPADYQAARAAVAAQVRQGVDGDVLLLPFSSYRQPAWNHEHKVLDPTGRLLTPDFLSSDRLRVGTVDLAGEDPRVPLVDRALRSASGTQRADRLADLGFRFVVTELDAEQAPGVPGRVVFASDRIEVRALSDVRTEDAPRSWVVGMTLAWASFGALLLAAPFLCVTRLVRRRARIARGQ